MNIYLMDEDGQLFCIKANTMAEAIKICEKDYLDYLKERSEEEKYNFNEETDKEYYYKEVLQSCSLVGELKN